jgi:hypothetical protein
MAGSQVYDVSDFVIPLPEDVRAKWTGGMEQFVPEPVVACQRHGRKAESPSR